MIEDKLKNTFSYNLKELVKKNNCTFTDLALAIGVRKSTISSWINGISLPRMDKIDKICEYFNINRSDLIEDKKKITVELLRNRPNIENTIIENVLNIIGDEHKEIYETITNNDISLKEKVQTLNKVIDYITLDGDTVNIFYHISPSNNKINNLLNNYNKLNKEGQRKAIEQIEMLTKIEEYIKNEN